MAAWRVSQAAPRCRRCPPEPPRHGVRQWARPCQLAAAALHAGRLAGQPVPARSPDGPARCGLGRPRMPLARSCRMPGGRFDLAPGEEVPEQRLAKRAKDLDLAMNPALTASPPRIPGSGSSAVGCRGRARFWAARARLGEESSDRRARRARWTCAEAPPHRSHPPAACADDAVTIRWGAHIAGPGPVGAPKRPIWRPNAPPCGKLERPQQGVPSGTCAGRESH